LLALDRRDLIAHPLPDLLWTVGPASSASHKRDLLLDVPFKAIGEQSPHPMAGEDGLRRALQGVLLADLAFAPSHWRGQGQQCRLGLSQAFLQVTVLGVCIDR